MVGLIVASALCAILTAMAANLVRTGNKLSPDRWLAESQRKCRARIRTLERTYLQNIDK